ncbi:hypothetical protein IFM89_029059 [Coptis chinensis]|uniref:Kinesin motor domain-containing protein n=1 Tax=Coptis chinensis TaxID=261450 RepID=A0A835M1L0_9MAGN|nr:hypothetical protein IFM89_029059 [Coptis chinensis]
MDNVVDTESSPEVAEWMAAVEVAALLTRKKDIQVFIMEGDNQNQNVNSALKLYDEAGISMPVQFQVSADGKSWAGTILTQESSSSDSLLWIPIIFEGDLAHIAACHLKEKDFVHVSGQLAGDPPQFTMEKSRSSSIQVMVNGINFVEESPQRKESHASYKQNEQATSSSLTHSETTSMPITEDKKDSTTTEHLWTDLLENPHEWWDNRLNKNNLKGADFKHKVKGEMLWLDESTPGWVVSKLESLNFINKTVQKMNGVKDRESVECSWRDLTYNPNRWRDHRKEKLNGQVNPKFPDFKHKDSGQALWISSAPKWVLSNLDALKFDNKGNFQKKKFDDKENSWKDLVENPNKWWDNRFDKLNQRAPDFKHKETGEGLWLSGSPDWVMPKLPPVKSKDVAGILVLIVLEAHLFSEPLYHGSAGNVQILASVKVVVRIRPPLERGTILVRKVSPNSLSVSGDASRFFTFDSVVDSSSTTQEDFFELVGVPLVKNSLAGYNATILSCGQTASGKTYTMWGPQSAMVDGSSTTTTQGIVPRIFHMLFSEIQEHERCEDKQKISYQCRCSFLEVYNEQLGDLLDPNQRNLQIRDDAKNGFYVENLTEEYVTSYDDVTQILIKGLSNRKIGATSLNSKSSRSHIVFTCVIESWCKGTSSNCFSSSKTSRINLVDVAGSERTKLDDAGRHCIKEARKLKRSIARLGHLVHILSEGAQLERSQSISYESSCLTHLLKESLGGNAKLTVICAISPDEKCKAETLSTLRFGVKAKSLKNEPVVNEITEDDVNDLSDQIRQLKEELIKAKSGGSSSLDCNSRYFKGRNARESLNQLRVSLNRSIIIPRIDDDSEEEIIVDEKDVKELCIQLDNLRSSGEENFQDAYEETECFQESSFEENSDPIMTNNPSCSIATCSDIDTDIPIACRKTSSNLDPTIRSSLSLMSCQLPSVLQEPTFSESPKIEKMQKKVKSSSLNVAGAERYVTATSNFSPEVLRQSVKVSDQIRSSLRSSKIFSSPTESLAASLHRGLQIIDDHQRASASSKLSLALSFEHLAIKPGQAVNQTDASVQTLSPKQTLIDAPATYSICTTCKQAINELDEVNGSLNMYNVTFSGPRSLEALKGKTHKDGEKDSDEALKIEKLEKLCAEQEAKIEQLNQLVGQYKQQKEYNLVIENFQETATHDEVYADSVGPVQEFVVEKEDYQLLEAAEENKILVHDSKISVVVPSANNEVRELQKERVELLKEIEILRNRLESFIDVSWTESQSTRLRKSGTVSQSLGNGGKDLQEERQRWIEKESEWICLTDELRLDLDSNRQQAKNIEMELKLERRVTEELDDALNRAVLGHARIVEHYADLQDKYNELLERHRKIMEGIAEIKRAAGKAGGKGHGSRFFKSLAAELSSLRVEKEREREHLKKENKSLRIQLRDTAEAVHAAGELLVRLREAEEAVSVVEGNFLRAEKETEKVKKQMEKLKRRHAMEMATMKQYLADSRLPESALQPLYWQQEHKTYNTTTSPLPEDDQEWRAEFGPIYQEHY